MLFRADVFCCFPHSFIFTSSSCHRFRLIRSISTDLNSLSQAHFGRLVSVSVAAELSLLARHLLWVSIYYTSVAYNFKVTNIYMYIQYPIHAYPIPNKRNTLQGSIIEWYQYHALSISTFCYACYVYLVCHLRVWLGWASSNAAGCILATDEMACAAVRHARNPQRYKDGWIGERANQIERQRQMFGINCINLNVCVLYFNSRTSARFEFAYKRQHRGHTAHNGWIERFEIKSTCHWNKAYWAVTSGQQDSSSAIADITYTA